MTSMLNAKINEKLDKLSQTYATLKKMQAIPLGEIQHDREKFWAVSYGLVIAIEAILDIGQIILSEKGIKAESYGKIIPLLSETGIIPADYADKMKGVVNFRNIAIHAYPSLNEALVHKFLMENIEDFKDFLKLINAYLASRDKPAS
jgi:uncharacterized protein YutE (UPF0331/DUF86 family)